MGAKIAPERFGHISRRAIAAATGLPNENVRRIVIELIDEGLVTVGPSGGVRNTGGNLQNPRILAALHLLFAEHLRTSQIFLDANAMDVVR
jgi:DNA-binding transcriptional regulator LsrR (DeoR family)